MTKRRARDLGLDFPGVTGAWNAITDVPGVRIGFTTLDDPDRGIKTGVTAILPRQDFGHPKPVWAGIYALNGNGEMTGAHWIADAGYFVGPICITNTHAVGMVHHGAVAWMIEQYAEAFRGDHLWAMPVVAETYDGVLNDINAMHVTAEHARAALESATSGPVAEGNVGGGNGMICYDFKGGTGSSSRLITIGDETYTIAALVQANHGIRPWLTVLGVPVGRHLSENRLLDRETGSIIVVLATDAPLSGVSLRQVAKRAAIGIGRGGSPGGNSSGDIFLAFSTANERELPGKDDVLVVSTSINPEFLDPLYLASVEAIEEAVINALVAAEDAPTVKPAGRRCRAIDHSELLDVMRRYGRAT